MNIKINGINEIRYISMYQVNSTILKSIFNSSELFSGKPSFSLMMITADHKVLLLQRDQSFHFNKVVKDLKINKINLTLIGSLYTSELEKLRQLFFDFIDAKDLKTQNNHKKPIHIFPGGQSSQNESVLLTLLRELREETTLNININDLYFNQSYIFNVLIYDLVVKKYFNNFIFPVKVNITSQDIIKKINGNKYVQNPIFIDIGQCSSLFTAFLQVQKFMLM